MKVDKYEMKIDIQGKDFYEMKIDIQGKDFLVWVSDISQLHQMLLR